MGRGCTIGLVIVVVLGAECAFGQVVQLPTFHRFSVNTSVSVPDRGSAYLGGVGRAAYGSSRFGVSGLNLLPGIGRLFGGSVASDSVAVGGASVRVTVIDLAAMDREVLSRALGRLKPVQKDPRVVAIENHVRSASRNKDNNTASVQSVAEIERKNRQEKNAVLREGLEFFAKGTAAEMAGKAGVAKIYYKMAARRVDPVTQRKISARIQSLAARK